MGWVRIGPRTEFRPAYLLLWLKICINSILGHSRFLFVLRLYQWTLRAPRTANMWKKSEKMFFTGMGSEGSGGPSTKFMHIFVSKMRPTKFGPGTKFLCICTLITGMLSGVLPAVCMMRDMPDAQRKYLRIIFGGIFFNVHDLKDKFLT